MEILLRLFPLCSLFTLLPQCVTWDWMAFLGGSPALVGGSPTYGGVGLGELREVARTKNLVPACWAYDSSVSGTCLMLMQGPPPWASARPPAPSVEHPSRPASLGPPDSLPRSPVSQASASHGAWAMWAAAWRRQPRGVRLSELVICGSKGVGLLGERKRCRANA